MVDPAASKANPLMDAKVRHEDPKKGLHDVRSFIGACNFYRHHIKNFTYTSAILTDLIKKSTTWRWGPQEQQAFDELKNKVANTKCLGVPRAQGEMILVTDASNVGGGGTLFRWQALEKEEFDSAITQWGTDGLNRDGTLKHSYPDDKWVLVPLGHWNWSASIWAPRDMSSCTLGLRRRMDRILFISSWNRAGASATPKGVTFHLNTLP